MTDGTMNRDRFEAIVECYGADPFRWPEGERAAALTYAEENPVVADPILADAGRLDAMLDLFEAPEPSFSLHAALRRNARPGPLARLRGWIDWRGPIWQPGGLVAAALLLGIFAGAQAPVFTEDEAGVPAISDVASLEPSLFGSPDIDEGFLQ